MIHMIKYRLDVILALKAKGYTTYKLRKEKLLSESTIQKLRNQRSVSWDNINSICKLLNCQPGELLEYIE
jgi:putative transcriptional regulator